MADIRQEIQTQLTKINEAISNGKNEELFSYYTEDCKMMAPGHEIASGKEGLTKLSEAFGKLKSNIGKTETNVEEVFGNGEVITCRAEGTTCAKDGSVLFQTRSVTVWKKIDGKWLVHNHIWNSDRPMPSN